MDNFEITSFDIDILKEIGNIGAGNAATALSLILNKTVVLDIPSAEFCLLPDIPQKLGGAEAVRTGMFFGVKDALQGYIFFLLEDEDADFLHKVAAGDYEIEKESVLSEIANIISGAYVGAISTMINDKVDITPPEIGHDMIGSLIDSIISALFKVGDKAVYIKTILTIDSNPISGYYVLMLEQDSLAKLLQYFKGIQ